MRRRGFTPPTSHSSELFSMRSTVSGEVEVALHASIDLRVGQRLSLAPAAGTQFSPRGLGAGGRLRSCDGSKRAPRRAPVKAARDASSLA
jgi:hypothetical protein